MSPVLSSSIHPKGNGASPEAWALPMGRLLVRCSQMAMCWSPESRSSLPRLGRTPVLSRRLAKAPPRLCSARETYCSQDLDKNAKAVASSRATLRFYTRSVPTRMRLPVGWTRRECSIAPCVSPMVRCWSLEVRIRFRVAQHWLAPNSTCRRVSAAGVPEGKGNPACRESPEWGSGFIDSLMWLHFGLSLLLPLDSEQFLARMPRLEVELRRCPPRWPAVTLQHSRLVRQALPNPRWGLPSPRRSSRGRRSVCGGAPACGRHWEWV